MAFDFNKGIPVEDNKFDFSGGLGVSGPFTNTGSTQQVYNGPQSSGITEAIGKSLSESFSRIIAFLS